MYFLILLCILVLLYLWQQEQKGLHSNPERNCLLSWACPIRLDRAPVNNEQVYRDRAARQNDTVTADGRIEHVTYPAPEPTMTLRDLYV